MRRAPRALALLTLIHAAPVIVSAQAVAQSDDKLAKRFKRLDHNGDGVITLSDLVAVGDRRMKRIDQNGDGMVSRAEFLQFLQARATKRVDRLFSRFGKMAESGGGGILLKDLPARAAARLGPADANKDGIVSRAELTSWMGQRATRLQTRIYGRFDANGDGRISNEELLTFTRDRFRRLDADGDGRVTRKEYVAAIQRWRAHRREKK